MPTTLPNGIQIVNVTPHDLFFFSDDWEEEVIVESDGILNCRPIRQQHSTSEDNPAVVFSTVQYLEKPQGRRFLEQLKEVYPNAIIVGSVIAAQAYRGEVFSPVPRSFERDRSTLKFNRLLDPFNFSVFPKENENVVRSC
jgi:hypothetical protein